MVASISRSSTEEPCSHLQIVPTTNFLPSLSLTHTYTHTSCSATISAMTRTSDLYERCTCAFKAVWWVLCNSPAVYITLFLWSPILALLTSRGFIMDYYKDVFGMPTDSSWLRYLYVDTPYTAYINNRVTLTLVLDILVLYTYERIPRLAYFDDPVTGLLVDIKSTVPLPKYSTTRDLFTFASPGHPLCPASKPRRIFMIFWIFICVMATAAMVTWKLHQWVSGCTNMEFNMVIQKNYFPKFHQFNPPKV